MELDCDVYSKLYSTIKLIDLFLYVLQRGEVCFFSLYLAIGKSLNEWWHFPKVSYGGKLQRLSDANSNYSNSNQKMLTNDASNVSN